MQTGFSDPADEMQKPGEICESCREFWKHQGLEPKRLQLLTKASGEIITTDGGIPIVICSRCDGDWITRLPKE